MKPRILLVEDDAVTCAFMVAALEALPADVDTAFSVAEGRERGGSIAHDLWLFDANLPDGDGAGLLAHLRAAGLATPALAHTAAPEPGGLDALRAAGFVDALVKPLPAAALQAAARAALQRNPRIYRGGGGDPASQAVMSASMDSSAAAVSSLPIWDDAVALAALKGQPAHVAALRKLFLDDLRRAHVAITNAVRSGDGRALRAALHKLHAGCGFVGAARLGRAAHGLEARSSSAEALDVFDVVAQATLSSP